MCACAVRLCSDTAAGGYRKFTSRTLYAFSRQNSTKFASFEKEKKKKIDSQFELTTFVHLLPVFSRLLHTTRSKQYHVAATK